MTAASGENVQKGCHKFDEETRYEKIKGIWNCTMIANSSYPRLTFRGGTDRLVTSRNLSPHIIIT